MKLKRENQIKLILRCVCSVLPVWDFYLFEYYTNSLTYIIVIMITNDGKKYISTDVSFDRCAR